MYTNRNTSEYRLKEGQFFTPVWAAEILFDLYFSDLTEKDMVWEPMAGIGNMIAAIPAHIPAIGSELDPELAAYARKVTGRTVLTGDARTMSLPSGISAIFGNPPFKFQLFVELMNRAHGILSIGQRAVFIIPAYFFQTSNTLLSLYRNKWTISNSIIPRDIFPGLIKPLIVASFIRENNPRLIGFQLMHETGDIRKLSEDMQDMVANKVNGPRSTWKEVVKTILSELGGAADLAQIYNKIEGRRPTENAFWKEQIRKVLQKNFTRISEGRWAITTMQ